MLPHERRARRHRQRVGRQHRVLDLAAIDRDVRQLVEGGVGPGVRVGIRGAADEEFPQFLAGGVVEGGVLEREVNAGFEGEVEGGDAVGGEEDDALVVFQGAEEDCGDGQCMSVPNGFDEDVRDTKQLRVRSCAVRCSRKTSASSMSTIAFQVVASMSAVFRLDSTDSGVTPSSPELMTYSGRRAWSAIHSAVKVLPTPGSP